MSAIYNSAHWWQAVWAADPPPITVAGVVVLLLGVALLGLLAQRFRDLP